MRQSPAPSLNPAGPISDGASCPCPLSAAPRASLPLANPTPQRVKNAGPRRRSASNRNQTPPLARKAGDRTPRGVQPDRPLPACAGCRVGPDHDWLSPAGPERPTPSRGVSRWWAPLLPGGPALVGFRPSSNRLGGASKNGGAGLYAVRVTPTRASPRARHPVTGTSATPIPPTARAVKELRSVALQSSTGFRPPRCPSNRLVSATELG